MKETEGGPIARSLDDLDPAAVMESLKGALGYDMARVSDDTDPYIYLDPGIDREWRYDLMDKAADIAGAAVWDHGSFGPREMIDTVREELYRDVDDGATDWRWDRLRDAADRLMDDIAAAPERFGVSGVKIDGDALAVELEDTYGLWVDASWIDDVIRDCTVPTTLIIGTRADFDRDWAPSRAVLRSAALWLDGAREAPWDPIAEGLEADYGACSLSWLCKTQGCDLAAAVNGLGGDFAASVRDAILEDNGPEAWGWPMVGLMTTLVLEDFAEATFAQGEVGDRPFATVPVGAGPNGTRQPTIGLIDPVNGSGFSSPIELERPIELTDGDIGYAMRDGVGGKWGPWWTCEEICGWVPSEFDRALLPPADRTPEIDREHEKKGMRL